MIKVKRYTIIILILITANLLISSTYYVSPGGNDSNSGAMDKPFASIQKAHDAAQPGDTIYLREGTYTPTSQTVFRKSGSANSYFVLSSYPGEVPVIDGENVPEGNINHGSTATWMFNNAKFWKIIGPLIVTNGRGAGIYIDGAQFLEFNLVESSYNGKRAARAGHGFMIWTGSDIVFNNCDAHHNANHLWKSGEDQEINQYQHGDGWRIFSGANIRFVGCRSWRNLDDNYDFYGADMPIELIDCWAAYAARDDSLGSITGIPDNDMPRIDTSDLLWGNGIKLGYNQDYVEHSAVRCMSWNNNAAGFHMNGGQSILLNVASYGNKVFGFDYTDGNKHEMNNNWEFGNNYDNPDYPEVKPDLSVSSHNSWDSTLTITIAFDDFVCVSDSGMLENRQSDGSLPLTAFLRLAQNSDLIDSGVDVGLAYLGDAPDIGAFEFVDETTPVTLNGVNQIPDDYNLISYPNPFNPVAIISYNLPQAGNVDVVIYDITGRQVIQLDSGYRTAGSHTLSWNATDDYGRQVASGIYLLRIQAGKYLKTIKMTYIR